MTPLTDLLADYRRYIGLYKETQPKVYESAVTLHEEAKQELSTLRGQVAEKDADVARLLDALNIIDGYNRLRNDLDAYLGAVAEWGRKEVEEKPSAKTYGVTE